ncbi:restriction endonuclease subunit S [Aliivibrio fischeri]|uniref:restriction endonuclease subunit S n=1 Tax=Aliivibrio fischeri TaxID=668 RepID=UPI000A9CD078|nr:restriction endonuclease subunit S [Aliivibrio fischeri]
MSCDYKLSEIINIIGGGTPKRSIDDYWGGDIPWLSVADFNSDDRYVEFAKESITALGLEKSSTKLLQPGMLIISARGTVGCLAQLKSSMAFNQSCYGLDAKQDIVINDYLYYFVKQKVAELQQKGHGAVFNTITKETFEQIDVTIPSKAIQIKVADILGCIDNKIANNTAMNQTLEKIAQRIFKSWFIDFDPVKTNKEGVAFDGLSPEIQALFPSEFEESELGMIPKGWKIEEFGNICHFRNGYAFKSKELTENPEGTTHKVFKMGNILKGGGFKYSGSKDFFDANANEKVLKHLALKGDLLMCMTDMKANVALLGHTALMPVSNEFLINQRVGHIRASKDLCSYFLYLLTNSSDFIHDLRSRANSGVQVNLSTSAIKETLFVRPETSVHDAFYKTVEPLFEKFLVNSEMNQCLIRLRERLIPRLISGQLTVGEAQKELAEAI